MGKARKNTKEQPPRKARKVKPAAASNEGTVASSSTSSTSNSSSSTALDSFFEASKITMARVQNKVSAATSATAALMLYLGGNGPSQGEVDPVPGLPLEMLPFIVNF